MRINTIKYRLQQFVLSDMFEDIWYLGNECGQVLKVLWKID
jgi:hypothetical protein